MKEVLTPLEMKAVDTNTAYNYIPTIVLMENAGFSIANYIINNYPDKKKIAIYSGTGGNGGDGFVIARHLLNHGYKVNLFLLARPENIKNEDSKTNWKSISIINKTNNNLKITKITDSTQLKPDNSDIIVDAILGTGVKGKLREPISSAIDIINYSPAIVLSVDIPSGLDSLTGLVVDKCVIATTILTLHKPKTGLECADDKYVKEIKVMDIGIPSVSEEYTGSGDLLKLKQPSLNSHKGDNGSVLIIGSNPTFIGAVVFAARACILKGVDLVYIVVPESSVDIIKGYNPEFMVTGVEGDVLSLNGYDKIKPLIEKVDSVLIGSGAGTEDETKQLFNKIVADFTDKKIIIDADALKLVDRENIKKSKTLLTPHVKEFELFFDCKLPKDLHDKIELLQKLSKEYNTVILLKGVVDIITSYDDYKLNSTGNQGMTLGGTGDILAGLATAISTKNTLYESAYIGAFMLGAAGDEALEEYGFNYSINDILKKIRGIS